MRNLIYRLRFALRLRERTGMSFITAWNYPCNRAWYDGDPVQDADEEVFYMAQA